jgi:hypothetical protein
MSAPGKSVTAWYTAAQIGELMSMTAEWPATGTPVGALTFEQTNKEDAVVTDAGDLVDLSGYYAVGAEPNPNGTAGTKPALVPTPGAKFRWAYDRTSGGAGAHLIIRCSGG